MEETRHFRGISRRLAVQYLENLGGERVDAEPAVQKRRGTDERVDDAGDGSGGGEPVRVEGDGWTAELTAGTVEAAGSIELTEVTVDFAGEAAALEPLVEAFARKAMRAGG